MFPLNYTGLYLALIWTLSVRLYGGWKVNSDIGHCQRPLIDQVIGRFELLDLS